MRYMLLIYGEQTNEEPPMGENDAVMAEWFEFDAAIKDAGVFLAGEALAPTETATSVRIKGDERVITDGPFAETREMLGGFYLIDVPDLDTALDWAARCPGARYGTMEVRPVVVFDTAPA